jgi:hypothetical protein
VTLPNYTSIFTPLRNCTDDCRSIPRAGVARRPQSKPSSCSPVDIAARRSCSQFAATRARWPSPGGATIRAPPQKNVRGVRWTCSGMQWVRYHQANSGWCTSRTMKARERNSRTADCKLLSTACGSGSFCGHPHSDFLPDPAIPKGAQERLLPTSSRAQRGSAAASTATRFAHRISCCDILARRCAHDRM